MESKNQLIKYGQGGLQPTTFDDMQRISTMFFESGIVPPHLKNKAQVMVIIQAGAERGVAPFQALSGFTLIKGRVGMEGHLMLALIRRSDVCEKLRTDFLGKAGDNNFRAVITSVRKGESEPFITEFSVLNAINASLWKGGDAWKKYPRDMLTWRAVSRHAKLYYSDIIGGFYTPDELKHIPAETSEDAQIEAEETISEQAGSETVVADFEPEASVEEYEKNMEENITPEDKPIDEAFLKDSTGKKVEEADHICTGAEPF